MLMPLAALAGCGDRDKVATDISVPELGPEIRACRQAPVEVPARKLSAGETERLWKTDRAGLVKVDGCLGDAIAHADDVKAGLEGKGRRRR